MPHNAGCPDHSKWKWVNKRWITRSRGGILYREQWATKKCKTCGGMVQDAMMKSGRLRDKH